LESKIKKLLKELKISNGDHLMLHGNLAILNQADKKNEIETELNFFLKFLKKKNRKKWYNLNTNIYL